MEEGILDAGPHLQEVINYFYFISGCKDDTKVLKHLVPNLEMILVFNFGPAIPVSFQNDLFGKKQINKIAVLGPLKKKLNYELQPVCDLLVVNFTLNGFYRLFGVSVADIKGNNLFDPDRFNNADNYRLLWEQLCKIDNVSSRANLLRKCLLDLLNNSEPASETLLNGRNYFNDPAIQPAKAIAADNGLAERTVQLRFQKYLGYSTKELIRFKRFKLIVFYLLKHKTEKINWSVVALNHGYYDQSHLIKDFKYFLDTTPEYFIKNTNEFCIIQDSNR